MANVNETDRGITSEAANGTIDESHEKRPLKILIVGGGMAGLTAAIALRKQGHEIHVYEQSTSARETGAAIHLAPNANGILRRLGIFAERFGANQMERLSEYNHTGEQLRMIDLRESNKQWQHPWLLAHRVDLHENLKLTAKQASVQLHTSSRVAEIDAKSAKITLADGSAIKGDIVLGADGVRSVTRKYVPGADVKPFSSGKCAFRFLVPKQEALDDPVTSNFTHANGQLCIWYGPDRRVVMYPTSDNQMLNFVCIHPETESESEASSGWNQAGHLDRMLKVYSGFDEALLRLLGKADPKSIGVWTLLDMKTIPNWTTEHLALLGDAAHPFLPHQGQGAGVAIEDAAALAVVLPFGLTFEEVPERLKLYELIRKERADRIQQHSRLAGEDLTEKQKTDMYGFTNYNFGHDEWDNSAQKLREWTWKCKPNMYWRMPIAFGPMPGPRQDFEGNPRKSDHSTFTTASIKFKTSRTLLQNLFPPFRSGWRFKSPGTIAYASFSQTTLNKMEWLGGSGYRHIGLYIHGVEYVPEKGPVIQGSYLPILFESLTDPIVSGREELGMPKLYTAIDIDRQDASYKIRTSWEGSFWGEFLLEDLVEVDPNSELGGTSGEADDGILAYRYLPRAGRSNKGISADECAIFDPLKEATTTPKPQRMLKAKRASFHIDGLDWKQLPTLHHVISRLAELPVYEIIGAKIVEGVGVPDVSQVRPV